jgi:hypothetical protein
MLRALPLPRCAPPTPLTLAHHVTSWAELALYDGAKCRQRNHRQRARNATLPRSRPPPFKTHAHTCDLTGGAGGVLWGQAQANGGAGAVHASNTLAPLSPHTLHTSHSQAELAVYDGAKRKLTEAQALPAGAPTHAAASLLAGLAAAIVGTPLDLAKVIFSTAVTASSV